MTYVHQISERFMKTYLYQPTETYLQSAIEQIFKAISIYIREEINQFYVSQGVRKIQDEIKISIKKINEWEKKSIKIDAEIEKKTNISSLRKSAKTPRFGTKSEQQKLQDELKALNYQLNQLILLKSKENKKVESMKGDLDNINERLDNELLKKIRTRIPEIEKEVLRNMGVIYNESTDLFIHPKEAKSIEGKILDIWESMKYEKDRDVFEALIYIPLTMSKIDPSDPLLKRYSDYWNKNKWDDNAYKEMFDDLTKLYDPSNQTKFIILYNNLKSGYNRLVVNPINERNKIYAAKKIAKSKAVQAANQLKHEEAIRKIRLKGMTAYTKYVGLLLERKDRLKGEEEISESKPITEVPIKVVATASAKTPVPIPILIDLAIMAELESRKMEFIREIQDIDKEDLTIAEDATTEDIDFEIQAFLKAEKQE